MVDTKAKKPQKDTSDQPSADKNVNKGKKRRLVLKLLYVLIILILAGVATFFFFQYQDLKNNPERAVEQEVTQLTNEIGRFMALPDETPTIATVEDASRLESQPFFDRAENGDKILIYTEAKQAIIYRESERKIINVGPIALNASGNEQE